MTNDGEAGVRYVDANGLRFAYLGWGLEAKDGPLVLAVHGFPDTPHTWSVLGPALADAGFRVVAPFLRGYAPTQIPERDTSIEDLGRDVLALVEALGAERAHLVGHDWGAEAVYAAAGLAPARVETLTGIAIPHRARLRFTARMLWGLRHVVELSLPGAEARFPSNDFAKVDELIRRWSPTWTPSAAELAPIKDCFRRPGSVHGALGYYRAARVTTPPFMKEPVRAPTLYVVGADDPAVSARDFEGTRSHFPGGLTVASIPGGHFCHREAPDALLPHLVEHLRASAR
ncbi:MAG: alpha/beta hydrolase [Labilithrix sp.]|nr:alpha/beta hydrolase [Labilithrix sp.]